MNLEQAHIKELLEKYYEGSSSLSEDDILKQYFLSQSIPDELIADRELFLFLSEKGTVHPADISLERKLDDFVNRQQRKIFRKKNINTWYKITSIAACIAILITCYLFINKQQHELLVKDTYKDPQQAYAEVKRTLLYISQHLNRGTEPLSNVSKINQGLTRLSAFSSFGTGLKELDLINKYYNEPKNENIKK